MAKPDRKPTSAVTPARFEAFTILMEVERGQAYADDLLRAPRVSALSSQDRNLCTTLVLGTLRWQIALDAQIKNFLSRPNGRLEPAVSIALRMGAFQVLHLNRIPVHAAINESVSLTKISGHQFSSGMVNAILRKIAGEAKGSGDAVAAHPAWLVERWRRVYGAETAEAICRHGQQQPELDIRLTNPDLEGELTEQGISLAPGAILKAARCVLSGDIGQTDSFLAGKVRIQDEGSQLVAELAGQGKNILDCCAAPGGKTLILAERNPDAKVTASEISPSRLAAMRERIAELEGDLSGRIHFELADATKLSAGAEYDLILADVPCSGTGTLGRNPEIRHRLKPEDLVRHHERQVAILRGACTAGTQRILYSTCSLEPEENAEVVAEVLGRESGWRQVSVAGAIQGLSREGRLAPDAAERLQGMISPDGSLTLLPGSLGGDAHTDGFFIAILEKSK